MERKLRKILRFIETAGVMFAVFDENDVLVYANRLYREAFFLTEEEYPYWGDMMRRNFEARRGTVIGETDFDLWLKGTLSRRGKVPFRAFETDVHDVLNIFQVTGLTKDHRYFVKPSPAKQGDFFEFFAEIDLLCAISTCPQGDLSVPAWGSDAADPISTCRPLGVEVYQPQPELLEGWDQPSPVEYRGIHGLDRT